VPQAAKSAGQRQSAKLGFAVLYALGQVNFLSDKSSRPHMAMADPCARFGIAPSTGGNKARIVRDALGIR
jgi:hypothetical protein